MPLAGLKRPRITDTRHNPNFSTSDVKQDGSKTRTPDFTKLLGKDAWHRLSPAVRARFRDAHGPAVYDGLMSVVRANTIGRFLAVLFRMTGKPVMPSSGSAVPARVTVFSDVNGGIVWERRYAIRAKRESVVRSTKCLADDGTLIECLPFGIRMRLRVYEEEGAIHMVSTGYYIHWGILRANIPSWCPPGQTHVVHRELGGGWFSITLSVTHRWFGELFYQEGRFSD